MFKKYDVPVYSAEFAKKEDYNGASFINIKSNEYALVDLHYPKINCMHATDICSMRLHVYKMLIEAAKKLPEGYKFKIWDAWRPFTLQQELYDLYKAQIISEYHLENKSEDEQAEIIKQFVSPPIPSIIKAPVHTTGGAVDVTIIDENNNELNMGTHFDDFSAKANIDYYENYNEDLEIRDNRRLLFNIMHSVGFTNLHSEWWHYDYGDQFWANLTGNDIIYKGVFSELDKTIS